jgi:rare lipoprotein A
VRSSQIGTASWYGNEHAGRPMANGEIFDPELLTAAHRSFPLGTRLRVTHLASGRSVIVTITDRGPYVRRRFIDLSKQAAETLGMTKAGLARVRIEALADDS